jgi:hypothetical protein
MMLTSREANSKASTTEQSISSTAKTLQQFQTMEVASSPDL